MYLTSSFQEFFGHRYNIHSVLFPYQIASSLERLNIEKTRYIKKHSVLPFFQLFLSEKKYESICNQMFHGEHSYTNSLRMQQKTTAQIKGDRIYYCPKCLEEHMGYESIHTFHQLHGVHVCPRHLCYLNSIPIANVQKHLHIKEWDRTVVSCEPNSMLVQIAEDVEYILANPPEMYNPEFREYLFDEALRRGIFRRGKWQNYTNEEWITFYSNLPKEYERYKSSCDFQRLSDKKLSGGVDPIEYLLFVRCLYGGFRNFMQQLS